MRDKRCGNQSVPHRSQGSVRLGKKEIARVLFSKKSKIASFKSISVTRIASGRALDVADGPGSVGSVDLCVHGHVGVPGGEDPVVGVGEDGGEGLGGPLPGLVEHLALQLGELVLQVWKVVGKGVNDAGVDGPEDAVVRSPEVLGACGKKQKREVERGCSPSAARTEE